MREKEEEEEALKDRKPPPGQLIRQNSLSRSGKNSVKNSWIRIVNRISTEIEWSFASETSHSSKKFIKICRQLVELYETFVQLSVCRNGKIPFKIPESVS